MIRYFLSVGVVKKLAARPASLSALLAGIMLLSTPFQVCRAVTVPDTAADSSMMLSSVALSGFHDMHTMPHRADARGMAVSGSLSESGRSVSLAGERQSGSHQTGTEARLYLFVMLGFAAIAAWLAEVQGRKD